MKIDFKETGISNIIKDYLAEKPTLQPRYNRFPHPENYSKQAKEKLNSYAHRPIIQKVISRQMSGLNLSKKQRENLQKLKQNNTLTVTTGHQLNLLTGPLYFIYKILHTVKICDTLNQKSDDYQYVPIYWMATEDHDFEEINHFNTYQKRYQYDALSGGFVGNIPAENAIHALNEFIKNIPENIFSENLKEIIKGSYTTNHNLAQATRSLVNELLGEFGILILDGNDSELKKLMIPYFKKELTENPSQKLIEQTNQALDAYKNQAYAREINLFYLHQNQRERIELVKDQYVLTESQTPFIKEDLLSILDNYPERFSPNVILRPLYQEVILPNVAYLGGGGEIAYWLQLKSVFEHYGITFPMLVVRNSMLLLPNAMMHKASSLNLVSAKMFTPKFEIKNELAKQNSNLFEKVGLLKKELENKFIELESIAEQTGDDFAGMVKAQKKKQLNGYDKLNKRLLLSEQKQKQDLMRKVDEVYDYIFPQNNWQERVINFSEFYKTNGSPLFKEIYKAMSPFNSSYHLLNLDSILK
ncbi:bacillithiol biosynthesis cysteine-adding enzyme BshC [Flavobacteriaceae bacterium Ap0902]|nr:bacillithiol biosynthesis cysteine-adding enzyme BshC [Flavobacteriaceae bacterium Ap0902]